jgi:tocopherol O-methyltransferase
LTYPAFTITPAPASVQPGSVADHYDELDPFYRELWGDHVHHGLWRTGDETPVEAAEALADRVADLADLTTGARVVDIGSGYGATARRFAEKFGARVTAVTVSRAQHDYALSDQGRPGNPCYMLADWLQNDLPPASFDAAIAIESTEHMFDLPRALNEAARVLVPGGRIVICAWLVRDVPGRAEARFLLEPICREGRLCGMGNEHHYRRLLADNGFTVDRFVDVSSQVVRTCTICIARVIRALLTGTAYWRFLLDQRRRNRVFLLTLFRIRLAYALGSMRYGIFVARVQREECAATPLTAEQAGAAR